MLDVTGHILPHALANLIHAGPQSNAARYWATIQNIRDCIAAGDAWFLDAAPGGWRVWTCSGFSAVVADKTFLTHEGRTLAAA
ncbi:hypothetical protein [Pannonibacter tanglangensis]|uniref:Uncharacterized protein n=1 Tax=Pannonibacter tanglangensis TaxID=2750084 RepID=A0ABW9ZB51_9HYPH|nr:hypothetical protein [Pannonibacter sp. XCT-34]NBN62063.1 hypothetical protein [Pannonibacter sp. XCT-34]